MLKSSSTGSFGLPNGKSLFRKNILLYHQLLTFQYFKMQIYSGNLQCLHREFYCKNIMNTQLKLSISVYLCYCEKKSEKKKQQKLPLKSVFRNRRSENMQQIYWRAPVPSLISIKLSCNHKVPR